MKVWVFIILLYCILLKISINYINYIIFSCCYCCILIILYIYFIVKKQQKIYLQNNPNIEPVTIVPYPWPSTLICGNACVIFIDNDRNLHVVGRNNKGKLGFSSEEKVILPIKQIPSLSNIKMVDCGYSHTICVDYNGNIYSFGSNEVGQLGLGKEIIESFIIKIIDIPPIDKLSCGNNFTICLTFEGYVYSFGMGLYGQLGLGNTNNQYTPQLIKNLKDIEMITCGGNHVICKSIINNYYSWGYGNKGQLGHGNKLSYNIPTLCLLYPSNIIDIKCGDNHSLFLTIQGQVYSCGDNNYGELGVDVDIKKLTKPLLVEELPYIQKIACGYRHCMCIDFNYNLWLFGDNGSSQLGFGYGLIYLPTKNTILGKIKDISSGGDHTYVKTINNKIYAFGDNSYTQLGKVTRTRVQKTPIQVLKNNEELWSSAIGRSRQKSARK